MKPPILSAADVARIVKQRNRAFIGASKAHKRVLVAKDVIAQVRAGRIKPKKGNWVEYHGPHERGGMEGLRELVLCGAGSCNVCALGAVMTSLTLFNNRMDASNANYYLSFSRISDGQVRDDPGITSLFSYGQLGLIELAFEKGSGYFHLQRHSYDTGRNVIKNFTEQRLRAIAFGKRNGTAEKRLLAIMRNIIKHRGSFVP